MKKLLLLLLLATTTKPDLVFHLGFHNPVTATVLHASHNAMPNDGRFSFKWTSDECDKYLVCSCAAIVITVAAYYTLEYLNKQNKQVKNK